ncbi:MAG: hypothetical protein MUE46_17010 [Xanthomonadales bacterium]|jgi:hypothetical protein|nr:hypothetical protein [Xanthomonadales bacterium]
MRIATTRSTGPLLATALALFLFALWLRIAPSTPVAPAGTAATRPVDAGGTAREAMAVDIASQTLHGLPAETASPATSTAAATARSESAADPSAATPVAAPVAGQGGLDPKRAETQRWFAPVARARSYGELAAALATLPGEESARRELLEPIARWCRTAAQEVYDTEAFQRYAPLRWRALMELRSFCIDAPDRTPLAGDWIQPLGMTLLMHFGRQTVGRLDAAQGEAAGRSALRDARQLVDQANALQWMQTQGLLALDPALGCRANCGPYYWAAAMLIACQDAGGCGYRSPVTLGYCAANFGGGGCRPGADYATALRDRLPQADWLRVQRAVQELQQSLAESG